MDGSLLALQLGALVACAIGGYIMLDRVDRGGLGAVLGLLLGPIGVVVAWVLRDNALRDREAKEEERRRRPPDPARGARRGFGAATAAAAHQAESSPIEELERLAVLRERGHLTDEEFNRQKAALLTPEPRPRTSRFR